MQFNTTDYPEKIDAKIAQISAESDQSWRDTVNSRYAEWIVKMASRGAQKVVDPEFYASAPHKKQARAYIAEQLSWASTMMQTAAILIGSDVAVKDEIRTEAIMRVYAEHTEPKKE